MRSDAAGIRSRRAVCRSIRLFRLSDSRLGGWIRLLIRGTATAAGLRVTAEWTDRKYRRGVAVTDGQMADLNIEQHDTCPQWNYTIKPRGSEWWNWN